MMINLVNSLKTENNQNIMALNNVKKICENSIYL